MWHEAPFGRLQALPKDGKPISRHADADEAYLDIAEGVQRLLRPAPRRATARPAAAAPEVAAAEGPVSPRGTPGPRSSNLRLKKTFTEADQDRFLDDAFEFVAKFFENSLEELARRNPGVEGRVKRVDAQTFTAVAYRDGKALARCRIFLGSPMMLGHAIAFSYDPDSRNSYNESLSVEVGDQDLALRPTFRALAHGDGDVRLTMEGAAEHFWEMFLEPMR